MCPEWGRKKPAASVPPYQESICLPSLTRHFGSLPVYRKSLKPPVLKGDLMSHFPLRIRQYVAALPGNRSVILVVSVLLLRVDFE